MVEYAVEMEKSRVEVLATFSASRAFLLLFASETQIISAYEVVSNHHLCECWVSFPLDFQPEAVASIVAQPQGFLEEPVTITELHLWR